MFLLWRHPPHEIAQKIIQFIILQFLSLHGLFILGVLLAVSVATVSVLAQEAQEDNQRQASTSVQELGIGGGRSLSESVRHVYQQTGGRILSVERVPADGHSINRVKYVDIHGRVRYMDDVDSVPEADFGDEGD